MLSNSYFYYQLLRKYVILFGNMFNNITFKKYNSNGQEINRIKVPIVYAPKDKMVTRFNTDPDFLNALQTVLPRLSFEITNLAYDASRKQNSLLRVAKGDSASKVASSYMGVPYDISFELNLYAKNVDDGTHIIEQILPYFNPDYTMTINPVPELGFLKDIPIILDNVTQNVQYEGNYDSVRYVNWTMTFTIKGYFFGPVSKPKIIKDVIANIFNDPSLVRGYITRINLGEGSGTFISGDTVFQGDRYDTASAYGVVNDYTPQIQKLTLGAVNGNFNVNNTIRAVSTNAAYQIASFDATPLKLATIIVQPDPLDAAPTDDFGYTTTVLEYPDTNDQTIRTILDRTD